MQAFRITVNGHLACTVGTAYVLNAIALLKGEATEGGAEPAALSVSGMTSPHTHVTWFNKELTEGDAITIEVVDAAQSVFTAPKSVIQDDPAFAEKQQRAHYERLKAHYEPTTA